jgi:hypothetical protein
MLDEIDGATMADPMVEKLKAAHTDKPEARVVSYFEW